MIKGLITAAIAGALAISFSACESVSYTPYMFDQLRAADYILPKDVQKVIITTTADINVADSSFTYSDPKYTAERLSYAQNMPSMLCSILSTELNNSKFLPNEIVNTEYKSVAAIEVNAEDLCKKHDAQAIIVLESSRYSSYFETAKGQAYSNSIVLMSTLNNRLVFINSNGESRRFETQRDTLRWVANLDMEQGHVQELKDLFPDYKELYYSISEQAAKHISIQLTPSWERRHRSAFGTSSNTMIMATTCVEKGEWDKARDIWAEVITKSKGKGLDAACATANLGLYYEREDNVLESAMWFSKALDIIEANPDNKKIQSIKPRVDMLFKRSIDRQHEKDILDRQMGE